MQTPLEIRYHGLEPSDAMNERIRKKVDKLERLFNRITSCRVTVDLPNQSKQKGNVYRVQVDVDVPGEKLIVGSSPITDANHQDAYVALRDSFNAMERKLQSYVARNLRHEVKVSEAASAYGTVTRLLPQDGFGFIQTDDEREIYFHENSIINGAFEDVEVGQKVRFHEEPGDKGPKATSVQVLPRRPLEHLEQQAQ